MKKMFAPVCLALCLCCLCPTPAPATVTVLSGNVVASCADSSCTEASDNVTVTWDLSRVSYPWSAFEPFFTRKITGGYFKVIHVDGDCDAVSVNFYTSDNASCTTSTGCWAEYMPQDAITKAPTALGVVLTDLGAASSTATTEIPVPFAVGTLLVKAVFTITDSGTTCTDVTTISFKPEIR